MVVAKAQIKHRIRDEVGICTVPDCLDAIAEIALEAALAALAASLNNDETLRDEIAQAIDAEFSDPYQEDPEALRDAALTAVSAWLVGE